MSGVNVVLFLLLGSEEVTAIAAEKDIVAGTLPADSELPAIGVETISESDHSVLAVDGWRFVTERVQMTASAADYPTAHDLLKAGKRACSDKFPEIPGLRNVSVVPAGGGPAGIHYATLAPSRTYDFMVSYEEPE